MTSSKLSYPSTPSGKAPREYITESSSEDDNFGENDSDEDIELMDNNIAHVYLKLPPPAIPIVPFNFQRNPAKEEKKPANAKIAALASSLSPSTNKHSSPSAKQSAKEPGKADLLNISTKEDFDLLKQRVNEYIDKLDETLRSAFQDPDDSIVYYASKKKAIRQGEDQPTSIQLLKALEKADLIIREIDRSRQESDLKRRIAKLSEQTI